MFIPKKTFYGIALNTIAFSAIVQVSAIADLPRPKEILAVQWAVSMDAPVFSERDVKTLFNIIESSMDSLGEVQEDIIDRFSKCDGDVAALAAKGKQVETISVPYHVASGEIKLVFEKARAVRKKLKDAKPDDLDALGEIYLPFVRQFHFVLPLVREVAKNSPKKYLHKVERSYRDLSEWASFWNEFATEAEKEEALTWQLLLNDVKSLKNASASLVEVFAPSDRIKVKKDYLAALDTLDKAIYGEEFENETHRRKFILEATKIFANNFGGLYESLSQESEQKLGADKEYDLLVYSMGRNELLKRYVKDLSHR